MSIPNLPPAPPLCWGMFVETASVIILSAQLLDFRPDLQVDCRRFRLRDEGETVRQLSRARVARFRYLLRVAVVLPCVPFWVLTVPDPPVPGQWEPPFPLPLLPPESDALR